MSNNDNNNETNQNPNIYPVNTEQAARIIKLCRVAQAHAMEKKIPVTLSVAMVGATGTAKSSTVRQVARDLGVDYWQASLALMLDSGDFGIPVPNHTDGSMSYYTTRSWPLGDKNATGIWAFEELDRCPIEIQRGAAHIMTDRELHGRSLSPNVLCVATLNGSSDSFTEELSEHIRTRVVSIFVSRQASGATEAYDQWAKDKVSLVRRAYNKFHRDSFTDYPFTELAVCNDRTLDMADCLHIATTKVDFPTQDIILPAIAGAVGKADALRFLSVADTLRNMPPISLCITEPDTAPVPHDPMVVFTLMNAMHNFVTSTPTSTNLTNFGKFVGRLPKALVIPKLQAMCQELPQLEHHLSKDLQASMSVKFD